VYHPAQRRAIVALKHSPRIGGFRRRSIWNAELRNSVWSEARAALLPDEFDDVGAISRGFASGDYYGMGMMPAGAGTVGFLWPFRHSLPRTTGSEVGVFGAVDVSLVYQSGRGERWQHARGREDFLRHGDLPWTAGGMYTASGATDCGDEQRLYFCGTLHSHGWYLDSQWRLLENRQRELIESGMARVGFARWPKDRLFGFRADPEGVLEIDLGTIAGPCELLLNYRTATQGGLRVELKGLPDHELEQAVPLTGDALAHPAAWRSGTRITPAAPSRVSARIHLDEAEIFAYELRKT